MTGPDYDVNASASDVANDQLVRLLKLAGKRPEPSEAIAAEVRGAVEFAWQHKTRQRSRIRRYGGIAAAATVLLGLAIAMRVLLPGGDQPAPVLASLDRVTGSVEMKDAGQSQWQTIVAGSVPVGASVRTDRDSRVAIALAGGQSLRIDRGTEIEFIAADRLALIDGTVYVDSGGRLPADDGVVVETPLGAVFEIGTQFEVRHDGRETRVRVREGRIAFEADQLNTSAAAGEQVSVNEAGNVGRTTVAPDSPEWHWAQAIAPAFELDGAVLAQFLRWIGRETGREIEFADAATARAAETTVLRGSIDGMLPGDALAVVLATTRFNYETHGDAIHIYRASQD